MKFKKIIWSLLAIVMTVNSGIASSPVTNEDPGKSVAAEALKVDLSKSKVLWKASKVGGEHEGTVKLENGTLLFEGNQLKGGEFVLAMETIVVTDITNASMNEKLVGHLKSDDFFSVEQHPRSTFIITKAEKIPNAKKGSPNYNITGDLTIKNIKHAVSFPATVEIKGNNAQAKAQVEIDRTKWDIKYRSGLLGTAADKIIHDNFILDINLVAGISVAVN